MLPGAAKAMVPDAGDDAESPEVATEKSASFTDPLAGLVKPSRSKVAVVKLSKPQSGGLLGLDEGNCAKVTSTDCPVVTSVPAQPTNELVPPSLTAKNDVVDGTEIPEGNVTVSVEPLVRSPLLDVSKLTVHAAATPWVVVDGTTVTPDVIKCAVRTGPCFFEVPEPIALVSFGF